MAHPASTKAFLQAAATVTMHCQAERWTHPPPSLPSFLLVWNLSSKPIAPTDNIWPKSDDAFWHHQLLKGFNDIHTKTMKQSSTALLVKWPMISSSLDPQAVLCYSVCYTNKKIIMYADTWDCPPNSATLSHVAINSVVGVKLPEDGNNSCSRSRALWRRVTLDVSL